MALPKKSPSVKTRLVPWDPENEKHVDRLYHQRIACGWNADVISKWQDEQRRGSMSIQWIVMDDSEEINQEKISKHVAKYPNEATSLSDTASSLFSKPRIPPVDAIPFIPVGHVSLDTGNSHDESHNDIAGGLFWVTALYVSRAIQNSGLGRSAMDSLEAAASGSPWNAKTLALDTIDKDWIPPISNEDLGFVTPEIINQEWYERRGYEVYDRQIHQSSTFANDQVIPLHFVFLKKKVIQ